MKKIKFCILYTLFTLSSKAQLDVDSANIYFEFKQYDKALCYCIKANELYKIDKYGFALFSKKDYENSLIFFLKALETDSGFYNDLNYKSLLDMVGYNYQNIRDYQKAVFYFEKAYQLNIKIYGFSDESNIGCIMNIIANYKELNNYKKQCEYYRALINIQKLNPGKNKSQYLNSLDNLAYLYSQAGDYSDAKTIHNEIIDLRKRNFGQNSYEYAISLNNLAAMYNDIGDYFEALPLFIQVLKILKNTLGEADYQYAIAVNNIANCYRLSGNYSKAEEYMILSLNLIKSNIGINNSKYATSLNNLAVLYNDMGMRDKAKDIYFQVLTIQKEILGESHPDYALSLNNLAVQYNDMGLYNLSEAIFIKAISIQKNILGENHPEYAQSLSNLAATYHFMGIYKKSEELFIKAISIQKNILGESHPDYANSLSNLASLYHSMCMYNKSEALYIESLKIQKKILGELDPGLLNTLSNLAFLYGVTGDNINAEITYSQVLTLSKKICVEYSSFLSSKELFEFINNQLKNKYVQALCFLSKNSNSKIKKELADFNLFIKNNLLINNQLLNKLAIKNKDSIITNSWQEYKRLHLRISQIQQLQSNKQQRLDELQNKSDSLEKILMRKLPEFQQAIINNTLTCKDIQRKLNSSDVSIDFVNFHYYDNHWTDTILYAAFITRSDWEEPKFVNLFNEEQLEKLFDSSNSSQSINNLYCLGDSDCKSSLYNLIWQPMDSLLTGVKRVYISPSGLLNRVSFSAIPTPGGGRLIDRYSVEVMSNIRTIAETKSNVSEKPLSISLIGGVNYDEEPTVSDSQQVNFLTSDTSFSNLRSLKGFKWSYLSGAENEVITLSKVLVPIKISLSLKTGSNASEELIKGLGSGNIPVPSVMHIATHGFSFAPSKPEATNEKLFLQNNNKQVFRSSEDALTRAGLVMAGGNKFWTTGTKYQNHEDGILTAREISELNLNGCILATLSACETGLGEIKGSEGVFGLQRAFKMAGVKYLIVSLWKVPDVQTTEFMKLFYSSWLIQKLPIREAFRQTQLTMSKKYTPYQWAAFVLVE